MANIDTTYFNAIDTDEKAYILGLVHKNNNYVSENDMKDIIKYNIIDCQVMWEILSYLRNNY
jgi:hypothetical protein